MKKSLLSLVGAMGVLALSPLAHATLLLPTYAPGGFTAISNDATDHNGTNPIGTFVATTGVETFSNTGGGAHPKTISGTFISEVWEEAGGTLDFYYQVQIDAGSTSSLADFDVSDFLASSVGGTAGAVDAGTVSNVALFGANTGTTTPFTLAYIDDGSGTLNFGFDGVSLRAGATSYVLAVSTNDTLYEAGAPSFDGTGGTSGDLVAFEPLASTPEPVSIILLGTVLTLSAFWIRRRRDAAKV